MFIDKLPDGSARLVIDYGPNNGEVHTFKTVDAAVAGYKGYESVAPAPDRSRSPLPMADPTAVTGIPPEPSPMARYNRGALDIGQGLKQDALMGYDAATNLGSAAGLGVEPTQKALDYTKPITQDMQGYQKGFEEGPGGFDWLRMTGQVVPTLPIGGGKVAGEQTAVQVAKSGGKIGGTLGTSLFTPAETYPELLAGKGIMGVAGIGLGSIAALGVHQAPRLATWVVEKAAGLGKTVYNAVRVIGATKRAKIAAGIDSTLLKYNLNFDNLDKQAQEILLSDARRQVMKNGKVDMEALGRKARLAEYDPMTHQITRSPADWNLAEGIARGHADTVGGSINDRVANQNTQLISNSRALAESTGGRGGDQPEQGAIVSRAISEIDKVMKEATTAAYETAASKGARFAIVPRNLAALVNSRDWMFDPTRSKLRRSVIGYLNSRGLMDAKGQLTKTASGNERAMNANEAEGFRKFISRLSLPGASQAEMAGMRGEAISTYGDDLVGAIDTKGEQMARDIYGKARALHTQRKEAQSIKMVEDLLPEWPGKPPNIDPDRFFEKSVLPSRGEDIADIMTHLSRRGPDGAQAIKEIQRATIEHIARKAGVSRPDSVYSGAPAYKAFYDELRPERLQRIFFNRPDILQKLQQLVDDAVDLTLPPPRSNINYSGSGTWVMRLVRSINAEAANAMDNAGAAAQTQQVMAGNAVSPQAPLIPRSFLDETTGALPSGQTGAATGANIYQDRRMQR